MIATPTPDTRRTEFRVETIEAGSLVSAGVPGSLWRPTLVTLAGAIGAGLAVSALTGTCATGRLLSALPYNRAEWPLDPARTLDALSRSGR